MAPARVSPVLEVEESRAQRAARCATRRTRPDPRAVHRESAVGCASDSRGAAEVGRLGKPVDGRQVHAATSTSTVTDVANVPHEPREPDHGRRLLRRADRHVQDALRARHPRARASTDRSRGRHRPSHSGLDGAAASQCLPRPRGARVSPARSRYGLRRSGNHHRRHEHPGHSNRAALALAECLRRARYRVDPT